MMDRMFVRTARVARAFIRILPVVCVLLETVLAGLPASAAEGPRAEAAGTQGRGSATPARPRTGIGRAKPPVGASLPKYLPRRLSVGESVRLGLENSERLKIAGLEIETALGQIVEARAAALPRIEAGASYLRLSGLGAIFPGGGSEMEDLVTIESLYQADVTLSQMLYQGGQVRAGLRAARLARRRAEVNHEFARTGIAYATRIAYASVLLRREFRDVAAESLALAQRSLDDVRSRRSAGDATDFDVLQASVRVRGAEAALFRTRAAVRVAKARFMRTIGLDQGAEVELTDGLSDLLAGLERDVGARRTISDYLRIALGSGIGPRRWKARGDLESADLAVGLQEISRSVSTAGRRPSLALQGAWTGNGMHGFLDEGFDFSWRWGLVLRVPVFDGLASRGRYTQALAGLAQAERVRESLAGDIEFEVRSAFWRLETAREAVASASEGTKEAQEAVRQAGVRYRNGLITELALEEARLGLARSRTNFAEARFELYRSMLDLQRAAGLIEIPAG